MKQIGVRAVFMRGGTSKALVFRDEHLPSDRATRNRLFIAAIGSPDPNGRQLDGMGGGLSSLSKICVIGPSTSADADVDYTFGQVSIKDATVDYSGNCGNMSSAVGPFAVDEGLVKVEGDTAAVRIHNTNTRKTIIARFALEDGRTKVEGDFVLPGVAGAGAPIRLDFLDPGGAATGKLLPTGRPVDVLSMPGFGELEASMIDAANPCVFVTAETLGLTGIEMPAELERRPELMAQLEQIRVAASIRMGVARSADEAARKPSIPKIAVLASPQEAHTLAGERVCAGETDICARMLSLGQPHRAIPLTGAMCLAIATRIPGSLAHRLARTPWSSDALVRIAQPSGLTVVGAAVRGAGGAAIADYATVYRTARRLMEGTVYVRASALTGQF
jgi:2-methylaconitate isomerase